MIIQPRYQKVHDHLENIVFGTKVIDQNDIKKVRAILGALMSSECLKESFNFLESESVEPDKWLIPI